MANISRLVAMGRRMKISEKFNDHLPCVRAASQTLTWRTVIYLHSKYYVVTRGKRNFGGARKNTGRCPYPHNPALVLFQLPLTILTQMQWPARSVQRCSYP